MTHVVNNPKLELFLTLSANAATDDQLEYSVNTLTQDNAAVLLSAVQRHTVKEVDEWRTFHADLDKNADLGPVNRGLL